MYANEFWWGSVGHKTMEPFWLWFLQQKIHAWKAKSSLQNNARTQKIIRYALVKENKKKCPQSETKREGIHAHHSYYI